MKHAHNIHTEREKQYYAKKVTKLKCDQLYWTFKRGYGENEILDRLVRVQNVG